jgi:ABC-type cobalamin/Fe3+-siderophores transport system ATPase subunit
MSLEARTLSFSYNPDAPILQELTVAVPKGKITALIGRNGCGKSTLLKLLNRLLQPVSGGVFLAGRDIQDYGAKELAQTMAHLTQSPTSPEGLTVKELVEFGRHPYRGFLGRSSQKDKEVVEWALEETSLVALTERTLESLSGGQRQRAWIAMALAQDTEYLLLDEPTTYLDIAHQLEVLELLTRLNQTNEKTIVMVVHDPNHASQYAHNVICLAEGRLLREGTPAEIFTEENVEELFGVVPIIFPGSTPDKPWCVPLHTQSLDR